MPNFWTKTVQKISESLSGPRTNDKELYNKMEEMRQYERGMMSLKNIVLNFTKYFEKILSYNREISECIFHLFDKNEEFKDFASSLTSVHVDNNKLFHTVINEVNELNKMTIGWENYYTDVMKLYKQREESRKVYDHYETKLEKLENKKDELIRDGKFNENSEFSEEVSRNEEKYLKAKEEYVNLATKTYDTIETLNNSRFNIVNPVLLQLYFTEMKLYESFSNKFSIYKNLEENLYQMKIKFINNLKNKNTYNPMAFTRNPYLEDKFARRASGKDERKRSVEPKKSGSMSNKFISNPERTNHNNNGENKEPIQKKQSFDDFDFQIEKRNYPITNTNKQSLEQSGGGWKFNEAAKNKPVMINNKLSNHNINIPDQQVMKYGYKYNEEFANLDNNFFNPNNISQRIETEQSNYQINQSRLDKYPTFHSIIEANDDNKSVISKVTNVNPFNIKESVEGYADFHPQENKQTQGSQNNVFWDFTLHNNNFNHSNIQSQNINNQLPSSNTSILNQNNNSSGFSNEIDFNELLGSSKRPFVSPINQNNVKTMNKNEKKIDPFEGFY